MSYVDILKMPIHELKDYINWKLKYESETEKARSESFDKMKVK